MVFAVIALFARRCGTSGTSPTRRAKRRTPRRLEFLDSIQGLATLKAFGRAPARADKLASRRRDLFRRTMGVLATNTLSRRHHGQARSPAVRRPALAVAPGGRAGAMSLTGLLVS